MENKLWALLEETLNIKYSGGWEIMNQSQEMVIELLCDVGNYDKQKVVADIDYYWNEVMEVYSRNLEKQDLMKERFFDTHFNKIKVKAVLGYYNKEAANNE